MAVGSARVKRTRCRTARVRAGGRSNAARFAVSQAWSGGGITPSGSSSDQELVDLVQVLRAARAGDEPVPGGDPSVDGRDDLPGPPPGSSSRPRQAVLADELLSAHGQPAGGGALHDEGGHPIGHLRPHEVGQRRDLVGRDVVRHQKNRAPS